MAILAECPFCHKKQSAKNKKCWNEKTKKGCGTDLDKAKRSKKVKYWIDYCVNGKARREAVGYSIEEARDADGKRRVQKRENRIFDIKPEAKMTFQELTDWYLDLEKVKAIKTVWRNEIALKNFNAVLGHMVVGQIKPVDLENYQIKRRSNGMADGTIDKEIGTVQTMVRKAFFNDLVSGDTLKIFERVEDLLKVGANARDRTLSLDEYHGLMNHLSGHLKPIIATALYTGMRRGEILDLTWNKVDLKNRMIRLEAKDTKENKPKSIPIGNTLYAILTAIPRAIHDNHVFLFNGKPSSGDIRTALRSACQKALIPYGQNIKNGFVFRDIRTTVKTNMLRAGIDGALRDKILGHSLKGMDVFYLKPTDEDLRNAMDKYNNWLDEQLANAPANLDQNLDQVAKSEN